MMERRLTTILAAIAAALAVSACDRSDREKLRGDAKQTWQDAKRAAAKGVEEAKRQAKEAGSETKETLGEAGDATSQMVADATITAKVKAALIAEKNVKSSRLDVETFQGKVILRGSVPEKGQVALAAQVARSVEGVKAVDNRLTVY